VPGGPRGVDDAARRRDLELRRIGRGGQQRAGRLGQRGRAGYAGVAIAVGASAAINLR
jgi:hypothetical protein